MFILRRRLLWGLAALALMGSPLLATAQDDRWVGAWASSQMIAENEHALPDGAMDGVTLRQVVRLTLGGERLRVRISNAFGDQPLHIASAAVAHPSAPDGSAVAPGSSRPLTFSGRTDAVIPAGAIFV